MSPPKVISYCGLRVKAAGARSCSFTESFLVSECNKTDYTPLCRTMGRRKHCQLPKPGQEHLINGKHASIENLYPQPTTLFPSSEVPQTLT